MIRSRPLVVINPKFIPAVYCRKRYLILVGGTDSGKSVFAAQKLLWRIHEEKRHRFLMIRKVLRTVRESVYRTVKSQIEINGLSPAFEPKDSQLRIECPHHSEIISSGIDDPEKLKSIHDITGIWVEEATELSENDFEEINRRLRGLRRYYKQIILSFNPIHPAHFLKRMFFDADAPLRNDCKIIHVTYKDNMFCDPADAVRYETYRGRMRQVYTLGEWGDISEPDQVIPFDLISRAYLIPPVDGEKSLGVDVARYGDDETVIIYLNGNHIVEPIEAYSDNAIDRTADLAMIKMVNNRINADRCAVDGVGVGAGVVDILKRKHFNVADIIAGASPIGDDSGYKYIDLRSQMWWTVRMMLERGELSLIRDMKLIGDLAAPRYTIERDKKIKVESKDDIKIRIGRSTDYGDAYVQAVFVRKLKQKREARVTLL